MSENLVLEPGASVASTARTGSWAYSAAYWAPGGSARQCAGVERGRTIGVDRGAPDLGRGELACADAGFERAGRDRLAFEECHERRPRQRLRGGPGARASVAPQAIMVVDEVFRQPAIGRDDGRARSQRALERFGHGGWDAAAGSDAAARFNGMARTLPAAGARDVSLPRRRRTRPFGPPLQSPLPRSEPMEDGFAATAPNRGNVVGCGAPEGTTGGIDPISASARGLSPRRAAARNSPHQSSSRTVGQTPSIA